MGFKRETAPTHVRPILEAFTDEELEKLTMYFAYETGHFLDIGFLDHAQYTRFANLGKAAAILVLEDIVRNELNGN